MKKTDNFFVIHNFNTVPTELLAYCKNYIIYDCSTDSAVKAQIKNMGLTVKEVENTGRSGR